MNVRIIDIPAGLLGYRGIWGQEWTPPSARPDADWLGIYLSPSAAEAGGYAGPRLASQQNGTGTLWEVRLNEPIRAVEVTGIAEGQMPNVQQLRLAIEQADAGQPIELGNGPLVEALGAARLAYVGQSSPGEYEIAISPALLGDAGAPPAIIASCPYRNMLQDGSWVVDGNNVNLDDLDSFPPPAFAGELPGGNVEPPVPAPPEPAPVVPVEPPVEPPDPIDPPDPVGPPDPDGDA